MKRILCVLVVFVVVLAALPLKGETFCQTRVGGTLIVFGNGIMNTEDDAAKSRELLRDELKKSLPPEEFNKLQFDLAYNKSYGFFRDLYESAKQKALSENLPVAFWRWLGNREIMPDALQEELKAMAVRFDFATRVAPEDLGNHVALYRTNMLEGKKVVVQCHSQGCLFANAAHAALFSGSNALATSQSFGIVAVATPASFTAGNGPYTTLVEDTVIVAISLATPGGVSPPRFPNVTNVGSGAATSDWKGHGYIEEYMAEGSRSIAQIMQDNTAMLVSLVEPPQIAQPGFMTVTLQWGIAYDIDLHVFEDLGPIGAHVFYNNMMGLAGQLDVDDRYQYGPEHYTVSCDTLQAGTYHAGVNYYYGFSGPEDVSIQVAAGNSVRNYTRNLPTARGQAGDTDPVPVAEIVVTGDHEQGFGVEIREVVPEPTVPAISFGEF